MHVSKCEFSCSIETQARTAKADETASKLKNANATTELTENMESAPLFEVAVPADAVLADSEIWEGVAPSKGV